MTKAEIIREIAEQRGVTVEALRGPSCKWPLAHIRQEAYALCHARQRSKQDPYSYAAIGRFFNRDHSTVRFGVLAHKARLANPEPEAARHWGVG